MPTTSSSTTTVRRRPRGSPWRLPPRATLLPTALVLLVLVRQPAAAPSPRHAPDGASPPPTCVEPRDDGDAGPSIEGGVMIADAQVLELLLLRTVRLLLGAP